LHASFRSIAASVRRGNFVSGSAFIARVISSGTPNFFEADLLAGCFPPAIYVVTAGGPRFLGVTPIAQQDNSPITVETHWPAARDLVGPPSSVAREIGRRSRRVYVTPVTYDDDDAHSPPPLRGFMMLLKL